jgi:hypothetical protein
MFRSSAAQLGGERIEFADEAYAFHLFPRIKLAAALWLGDDEFPASAQILFNAQPALLANWRAPSLRMLTRMLINTDQDKKYSQPSIRQNYPYIDSIGCGRLLAICDILTKHIHIW